LTLALATSVVTCDAKPVSQKLSKVSESTTESLPEEDMLFDGDYYVPSAPPPEPDISYLSTSSVGAAIPKCPKGEVHFQNGCYTAEELTEISEFNDDAAVSEISHTDDHEKKAKASNKLIRAQEHAVDIADAKLDVILEELKEEQAERDDLE